MAETYIRFYEELNDFLPREKRKRAFSYSFDGHRSVADLLELLGVPSSRVDLILADGEPVSFQHVVQEGERLSFYPMFETFDITDLLEPHRRPLRRTRFAARPDLPGLARYLRICGFDTLCVPSLNERVLGRIDQQRRILLVRRSRPPESAEVARIIKVRDTKPRLQLAEVLSMLDLHGASQPFTRCPLCNEPLRLDPVTEPDRKAAPGAEFSLGGCRECSNIQRRGVHYGRWMCLVRHLLRREPWEK